MIRVMAPGTSLVTTIVVSLAVAYAGGLLARAVRLPPLVGYLLAGVILGPFTPGFVADEPMVEQLAEIGVALLLFGVGLHFSIGDLVAVWRTAVPGAILQVAASGVLGFGVGRLVGFAPEQAALFAACLAVASTVVATRTLGERDRLQTEAGRVALGWLVMQDLIVVGVLVMLPAGAAGGGATGAALALQLAAKLAEVVAFAAAMLLLGRRLIPRLLAYTARDGTHELFRLAVIVVALGIAYLTTELIGVSPALGAFFAGVVIADSDMSHQAAGESVPVQQVFTVLFFVSVGMLFDPAAIFRVPWHIAAAAVAVIVGNGVLTLLILLVASRGATERGRSGGFIGADRRILLHSQRDGRQPGAFARGGSRSRACGRAALDPAAGSDVAGGGCRRSAARKISLPARVAFRAARKAAPRQGAGR